jgi:hypothetical protein
MNSIEDLLKLARVESPYYSNKPIAELRTKAVLHNIMSNPKGIVLVDDEFKSILVGEISPDWLTTGWTASIRLVYSRPGNNGLDIIKTFIKWAKGWPQVDKLYISTSFGGDRAVTAERIFKRLGLEPIGPQFIGDL